MSNKLIEVNNLKKYFPVKESSFFRKTKYLKAVDNVSFYIKEGETFGLVGESGCGKSTIGRLMLRLLEPTGGKVNFDGKYIGELSNRQLQRTRRDMQMIFQDPFSSLNPRSTVSEAIAEPLIIHKMVKKEMVI